MLRRLSLGWWIAAAVGVAVAVRWFVTLRYYRDLPLLATDNFFYHQQANLLADGKGFINPFDWDITGAEVPTAAHPPGYTVYLAIWSFFGADSPLWHRMASGLLSALTVVPVALLVNRLAGRRAAIVAGFITALYPPLWMNDPLILSESLAIPLFALALWQAHRMWDEPSVANVLGLTVVLSAGALTRSEPVLLYVFLLTPLVMFHPRLDLGRKVRLVAMAAGVAMVIVAPWVVRNLTTFDEPTFFAVGPGYVLELGNCDLTYSGDFLGYWNAGCDATPWPDGDESVIGAAKLDIARDYIGDHLSEQPKVMAARMGRLFGLFRPLQTADWDVFFERRLESHVNIGLAAHYVMTALAIGGLALLRRRGETIIPLVSMIAVSVWTAAITFGITRYRISADVAIVVAGAVAIGALLDRWLPLALPDRDRPESVPEPAGVGA